MVEGVNQEPAGRSELCRMGVVAVNVQPAVRQSHMPFKEQR